MTQTLPQLLAAPLDPCHCEASAYPWWFILDPRAITGRPMSAETAINAVGMSVVTGPFFSRESASKFLKDTRYNFGKDAVVWCSSGCFSEDYAALLEMAKAESVQRFLAHRNEAMKALFVSRAASPNDSCVMPADFGQTLAEAENDETMPQVVATIRTETPHPGQEVIGRVDFNEPLKVLDANGAEIGTVTDITISPANSLPAPAGEIPHLGVTFAAYFKMIQAQVHDNARTKGWWEEDRNEAELIALEHAELSEALEALRHSNGPSEHIPEFSGVEEELADVIIRIMDHASAKGHRVAEAIIAKMAFNSTREYRHGGKAF